MQRRVRLSLMEVKNKGEMTRGVAKETLTRGGWNAVMTVKAQGVNANPEWCIKPSKQRRPNHQSTISKLKERRAKNTATKPTMDLSELVQKTREWGCEEPTIKHTSRVRGTGSLQMLAGKMMTTRKLTTRSMKSICTAAWPECKTLRISDAGDNIFVLNFQNSKFIEKVWSGRPWKLSDTLLVLKKWNVEGRPSKMDFSNADMWIQVHDLPQQMRTTATLDAILRAQYPEVLYIEDKDLDPSIWVRFIRAQVSVKLDNPLPYVYWADEEEEATWVNYKYEKLPSAFCYDCGRIRHSFGGCDFKKELVPKRYGNHTRAGVNSPQAPTPTRPERRQSRDRAEADPRQHAEPP
ncbi:hypothetical protein LINGRAHAP2_LOCUS14824 [Linum grandiflorum]